MADDRMVAALVDLLRATREVPDMLSMPPSGVDITIEAELATLRARPHDVALHQLRATAAAQRDGRTRPLPAILTRPGVSGRLATAFGAYWDAVIAPHCRASEPAWNATSSDGPGCSLPSAAPARWTG